MDEEIKNIMRIDLNTMLASNYVGQNDLAKLVKMNYGNWLRTINSILNLGSFTKAKKGLDSRKKTILKPRLDELENVPTIIREKLSKIIEDFGSTRGIIADNLISGSLGSDTFASYTPVTEDGIGASRAVDDIKTTITDVVMTVAIVAVLAIVIVVTFAVVGYYRSKKRMSGLK